MMAGGPTLGAVSFSFTHFNFVTTDLTPGTERFFAGCVLTLLLDTTTCLRDLCDLCDERERIRGESDGIDAPSSANTNTS
jgi:hypothetical protein